MEIIPVTDQQPSGLFGSFECVNDPSAAGGLLSARVRSTPCRDLFYRMWALGVIPEWQGRAIDTLLYHATYEAIYSDKLRLEINYVLEDNDRMNNAIMKLGARYLRRYRVYEMPIV